MPATPRSAVFLRRQAGVSLSYRLPTILKNRRKAGYGLLDHTRTGTLSPITDSFKETRQLLHRVTRQASPFEPRRKFMRCHGGVAVEIAPLGYNIAHSKITIQNHVRRIYAGRKIVQGSPRNPCKFTHGFAGDRGLQSFT